MKIVPLTIREACDFVERHHRHLGRTPNDGGKFAIGLVIGDELIGAAVVGRPTSRMLQEIQGPGTAELLRNCVSSAAPRNACSRLEARCKRIWQLMGGTRLVTYNLASESGASLRAVGFAPECEVKARSWNTPSRPRAARAIEDEDKVRWSVDLPEVPA
jgi:hypothetical protein